MPSIHQFVCSFHRLHSAVCGCMQHFASTIPARHTHHTYIYKYIPLTSFAIHSYSWCLTSHECVELVFIFIIFWHSHQCHWSKCIQTFARLYCVCVCARLPCVPHSTEEHIPFMCTHNRQTGNGSVPYKRTYTMQTQTYTHHTCTGSIHSSNTRYSAPGRSLRLSTYFPYTSISCSCSCRSQLPFIVRNSCLSPRLYRMKIVEPHGIISHCSYVRIAYDLIKYSLLLCAGTDGCINI